MAYRFEVVIGGWFAISRWPFFLWEIGSRFGASRVGGDKWIIDHCERTSLTDSLLHMTSALMYRLMSLMILLLISLDSGGKLGSEIRRRHADAKRQEARS
jgi:hypothetical protein